ncbi:hypothetical protein Lepto7376_0143 [[Leptolyngbya] sp. PCC 7376]|uniref:hypothetical protein n=1 Tax=[Leptolyngbya] sp. PCC 7376 TaxID=111781 RepID=UPI00029EFFB9|nr:hypothetical protein [[Leptolyngbya] sp. PCC 7376]AFY36591.1 hypothetical protein Lepto7376_0143 [[Leptolyngbya] sp. PCC 7376]
MIRQQFQKNSRFFSRSAAKIALSLGLIVIAPSMALAMPAGDSINAYLFGTTPEAGQIGHDYIVMQKGEGDNIQGAFYQINSEYACFSGEVAEGKLNLAVIDPYEEVAYDYQMDYTDSALIANSEEQTQTQIVPEGFHLIDIVTDLASTILAQCSADNSLAI